MGAVQSVGVPDLDIRRHMQAGPLTLHARDESVCVETERLLRVECSLAMSCLADSSWLYVPQLLYGISVRYSLW